MLLAGMCCAKFTQLPKVLYSMVQEVALMRLIGEGFGGFLFFLILSGFRDRVVVLVDGFVGLFG